MWNCVFLSLFLSTPSARRATSLPTAREQPYRFLSTPSAWRATAYALIGSALIVFLSTPSARRATPSRCHSQKLFCISIHALREEGDHRPASRNRLLSYFYPRPPRGGRHTVGTLQALYGHFYPRPPRGGRRFKRRQDIKLTIFLSTPSARRATEQQSAMAYNSAISIHALREEGDRPGIWLPRGVGNFYPRPPRGGRLTRLTREPSKICISIHALREEGDLE